MPTWSPNCDGPETAHLSWVSTCAASNSTPAICLLDILRRPEVMALLAEWNAGAVLGADTRARVAASSALAVVSVPGLTLTDYAWGSGRRSNLDHRTAARDGSSTAFAGVPVCPQPRRASGVVADVRPRPAPSAGPVPSAGPHRTRRVASAGAQVLRCSPASVRSPTPARHQRTPSAITLTTNV